MNPESLNNDGNMQPQNFDMNVNNDASSQNLGSIQQPSTAQPEFTPFENLNSESLNVPQDTFNPAPVDPSTFNAEINNELNSVESPAQQTDAMSFEVPTVEPAPVENQVSFPETPSVPADIPVQAPTVDTSFVEPAVEAPVMETTPEVSVPVEPVAPVMPEVPQNTVFETPAPTMPTADAQTPDAPTLPIPDQMPLNDYQAGVSTPVDYATPMSDFDQIGSTPELNPKEKSKKTDYKKTFLFCLLIILIAALGGGAYYLINIKGIFNSKGVETKDLTVEIDDKLSTVIDDYGTFKNTSATNCILDTTKVDTSKAGKYTYTIKCGNDSYEGTITVKDNQAPIVAFKLYQSLAGVPVNANSFLAKELTSGEKISFVSEDKVKEDIQTAGLKILPIKASDEAGNEQTFYAPYVALTDPIRVALVANKINPDDKSNERIFVFCNSNLTCEASFKAQIIKLDSKDAFKEIYKTYKGEEVFTVNNYSGVPLFFEDSLTIAIITELKIEGLDIKIPKSINDEYVAQGYQTQYKTEFDSSFVNFDYKSE